VDRFEKAGLVRRECDEAHRRKVFIAWMPETVAKIGRFYPPTQPAMQEVWSKHSDGELLLLLSIAKDGYRVALDATKAIKSSLDVPGGRGLRRAPRAPVQPLLSRIAEEIRPFPVKDEESYVTKGDPMTTPSPVIRLHPADGVLIARASLPPGTLVADGVTTVERIPSGHKVAIKPIAVGEPVIRYGQIIGFATTAITPGQHVHTQNCGMGDFAKDYAYGVDVTPTPNFDLPATFEGIRRSDGRVATRNYIGILTSVNCSAHVAGLVADAFKRHPFTGFEPVI